MEEKRVIWVWEKSPHSCSNCKFFVAVLVLFILVSAVTLYELMDNKLLIFSNDISFNDIINCWLNEKLFLPVIIFSCLVVDTGQQLSSSFF